MLAMARLDADQAGNLGQSPRGRSARVMRPIAPIGENARGGVVNIDNRPPLLRLDIGALLMRHRRRNGVAIV